MKISYKNTHGETIDLDHDEDSEKTEKGTIGEAVGGAVKQTVSGVGRAVGGVVGMAARAK
jgi:hypothetical protein